MPILERSFVGTPSNALCGLHARVETALGEGDKVVTIMQVKSSIHYKLSIVYLATLHSEPRMVQNLSQCWSIHRYNIQQ